MEGDCCFCGLLQKVRGRGPSVSAVYTGLGKAAQSRSRLYFDPCLILHLGRLGQVNSCPCTPRLGLFFATNRMPSLTFHTPLGTASAALPAPLMYHHHHLLCGTPPRVQEEQKQLKFPMEFIQGHLDSRVYIRVSNFDFLHYIVISAHFAQYHLP